MGCMVVGVELLKTQIDPFKALKVRQVFAIFVLPHRIYRYTNSEAAVLEIGGCFSEVWFSR